MYTLLTICTVHLAVTCNECAMYPIQGTRYKCLMCQDYDLCEKCESQNIHEGHVMAKIPFFTSAFEVSQFSKIHAVNSYSSSSSIMMAIDHNKVYYPFFTENATF